MKSLYVVAVLAVLSASSAAAETRKSVTVEIDADLLSRAEALNMDLSAFLEKHLETALGAGPPAAQKSAQKTHRDVLTAAMDNLEAVNFAPLQITSTTPAAEVEALCRSVESRRDELLGNAESRRTLPLPDTLEEARALDQYRMERLQSIKARIDKQGRNIRANAKIMEKQCPGLKDEDPNFKAAFRTIVAPYGPRGWCQAMMRKPQSAWSMQDGQAFARFCTGGKTN